MKRVFVFFGLCIVCLCGCSQESREVIDFFRENDSKVPVLIEVAAESDTVMRLTFDEEVRPYGKTFDGYDVKCEGCNLYITLPDSLSAGECVTFSARVRDLAGNSMGFSTPVWGYNPMPAIVKINEFTLTGTEKQPQRTELYVENGGYLSGLCLYSGTPETFQARVILPKVHVNSDSYVVIWWVDSKTFRKAFECDSLYCTVKDVVHICADNKEKLPASNGVQCLAVSPSPGAGLKDAVVYSKKTATKANGFGSDEVLDMAKYIDRSGQWAFDEVDAYYAVDVSDSTATRSVCRKPGCDSDSSSDWYITVTGGSTFGGSNTSEEYVKNEF